MSVETGLVGDSILSRAAYGGGYGRGGYNGNFSQDGSVINANVEANRSISLTDQINRTTTDAFLSNKIGRGNDSIENQISRGQDSLSAQFQRNHTDSHFDNITAQFASLERSNIAAKADTDRQLHAMELKQVECCCELRAGQAAINAKLETQGEVAAAVAAARSEARLEALIAAGNRGPGNSGN